MLSQRASNASSGAPARSNASAARRQHSTSWVRCEASRARRAAAAYAAPASRHSAAPAQCGAMLSGSAWRASRCAAIRRCSSRAIGSGTDLRVASKIEVVREGAVAQDLRRLELAPRLGDVERMRLEHRGGELGAEVGPRERGDACQAQRLARQLRQAPLDERADADRLRQPGALGRASPPGPRAGGPSGSRARTSSCRRCA